MEKSWLTRETLLNIHVPGQIQDFEFSENENLLSETQDFKFIPCQRKSDSLPVTLAISKIPGDQILALNCNKKPLTQFQTTINDDPISAKTNGDAVDRIGKTSEIESDTDFCTVTIDWFCSRDGNNRSHEVIINMVLPTN